MREISINARVQAACLRRGTWSAVAYGDEYIRRVQPRIVITCIDNFWEFYELKSRFPGITFVTVQNGVRGPSDDIFGHFSSEDPATRPPRHVDEMLVYGTAVGRELTKYVSGRIHTVGSARSNALRWTSSTSSSPRTIVYVSTRRSTVPPAQRVSIHGGTAQVSLAEVYARRDGVVRHLANYCARHDLALVIAGKDDDAVADRRHYEQLLGTEDFSYEPRTDAYAGYRTVDRGDIVVFTSSSLGYEALGRGRRIAALFTDIEVTHSVGERFGWPLDLPDDGPFWTHRYDEDRFDEILDTLRTVDAETWRTMSSSIADELMRYDEDNSVLRAILRNDDASLRHA
jgi:surface carbohydrate biosynthesis protein